MVQTPPDYSGRALFAFLSRETSFSLSELTSILGNSPSGNANIPAGTAVLSVLQCFPTLMLSGCITPNRTQVTLSANLTGNITSGTNITFSRRDNYRIR
jgi:hypothetical protein